MSSRGKLFVDMVLKQRHAEEAKENSNLTTLAPNTESDEQLNLEEDYTPGYIEIDPKELTTTIEVNYEPSNDVVQHINAEHHTESSSLELNNIIEIDIEQLNTMAVVNEEDGTVILLVHLFDLSTSAPSIDTENRLITLNVDSLKSIKTFDVSKTNLSVNEGSPSSYSKVESDNATSDDQTSDNNNNIIINKRKRMANPGLWKNNIIKRKRNLGQPYENEKGMLVEAKTIKPSCNQCIFNCTSEVQRILL